MAKKRFRCWIGLHDWQRVGEKGHCGKCYKCYETYCSKQIWDKVCIAPGCRAVRLKATESAERHQKAKEVAQEREQLAKLKLELIKGEKSDLG